MGLLDKWLEEKSKHANVVTQFSLNLKSKEPIQTVIKVRCVSKRDEAEASIDWVKYLDVTIKQMWEKQK